ncbi:uncharacterized protein [Erythrolamprus reginae]|uniref:uncharacterized protein isoform X2 n=1 Tax=Erythrolamprus reginae TaxID=121349 RepID=UPI00396CA4AE
MGLPWVSVVGLAFLCLPTAASGEPSQGGDAQFLGQWHIHGMASDCGLMMDAIKEPMICNVTSTEEGTFTMATTFTTEYGPMDMEMTYTKQEDGMYKNGWSGSEGLLSGTVSSSGWGHSHREACGGLPKWVLQQRPGPPTPTGPANQGG